MSLSKFKTLFLSPLLLLLINLSYAIPLDLPLIHPTTITQNEKQWQTIAAKNAFDLGLFNLAEQLYTKILTQETDPLEKQEIRLQLATTLLNEAKFTQAKEILDQPPQIKSPEAQLLLAITSLPSNPTLSKNLIDEIHLKDLPPPYQPWLLITKALIAQNNQNFKEAKNAFVEARSLATSENLKSHIDLLLFRLELSQNKAFEALEKTLAKKVEKNKDTPQASILKQYAIVLNDLDKKSEAINILESSVDFLSPKEKNETDSILLLIALIAEPTSEKGQFYLEKIIERKQNLDLAKIALSLLTQQTNPSNAQHYLDWITKLIESPQKHPLIDTLLIHRAQLYLYLKQHELAQLDASLLLDEYPGSTHYPKAMKILAYTAWSSSPPHYRTAASILSKLAEITTDASELAQLNTFIADAYFLNHDYTNAAKLYTSLLESTTNKLPKGPLLYQLILSTINQNSLNTAEKILDKFHNNPSIDPSNLWRAEWNLINAMKNKGHTKLAFARIQKLLQNTSPLSLSDDLKLRLLWLKAELSLESKNPEETPEIIDSLLSLLESSNIEPEQKTLITSHALLLEAQALLELQQEQEALNIIQELRNSYPDTKPAILSYIIEARYYTSINNPTKAQQQLINLSDNYPDSEYATISLYEAAINAESRGLKNTYQEALAILERLHDAYPNNPLAYHARFKQSDILRKLGDFSDAQLLYENLIKQYPDNPEKPRTQLALLDCLLAQSLNNPGQLTEIATQYTHLLDLSQLPTNLRAEAGFKAGFSLTKAGQTNLAKETFWLTINKLLIDPALNKQLNDQGKYWIARSIFELANLLEKTSTTQEANEVYQLISLYNLPGLTLAQSKMK